MSTHIYLQALIKYISVTSTRPIDPSINGLQDYMSNLDNRGIRASNISYGVNVFNIEEDEEHTQQCIDYIRLKSDNIGNECISIITYFQDRREMDPDFYFSMEVDHEGTIRSVFSANGRERSSNFSLGYVVVFDTTYKKYHITRCKDLYKMVVFDTIISNAIDCL